MTVRHDWRRIRKHRTYRVEEAARALGVCKETVCRWMARGLPAVRDCRPYLIRGEDLIVFIRARRRPKAQCALDEAYCVKCKAARPMMAGSGAVVRNSRDKPFLKGHCATCGTRIQRPVKAADVDAVTILLASPFRRRTGT